MEEARQYPALGRLGQLMNMTIIPQVVTLVLLTTPVAGQQLAVPSGLMVTLFDVQFEANPPLARFRFVAPAIAGGAVPFEDTIDDITYLCGQVVVPALAANGWTTGEVVMSLSAAELPFGEIAPEVTQYFQPFSIQDSTCIWEDF